MNNQKARRNLFGASIAASSLFLVASCGGGGDDACTNTTFCPAASIAAGTPGSTANPAVQAPTSAVVALAVAPASITIGNCTTGVPFIFRGGQPPYTVFTSNNFAVPVSAPLPLDANRSYFFADVHFAPTTDPDRRIEITSTVTVLDSQSQTAAATITTPVTFDGCTPNRPPFEALPESANFRTSEERVFDLSGGSGAVPTVTFADVGVARVVSVSASQVRVQAVATTSASTLMTIADGGQRTSVVINVLPQP